MKGVGSKFLKSRFESIVRGIRSDYDNIRKLHTIFLSKASVYPTPVDDETRAWITDVYLDKAYELYKKLHILFAKMSKRDFPVNIDNALNQFEKACHNVCLGRRIPAHASDELTLIAEIEWSLSELRKNLTLSDYKDV